VQQELADVHARLGVEEREQRAREVELSSVQIALQSERNKAQDVASELESTKARVQAIRVQIAESKSAVAHEERALHTAESELKQVRLQRDEHAAAATRVRQDIDEQRICLSEEAALLAQHRSALAELRRERSASRPEAPAGDSSNEASAQKRVFASRSEVDGAADGLALGAEIERRSAEAAEDERQLREQRDVLRRLAMQLGALRDGTAVTRAQLSAIRQALPAASSHTSPSVLAAPPGGASARDLAAELKPMVDALLSSLELRSHANARSSAGAAAGVEASVEERGHSPTRSRLFAPDGKLPTGHNLQVNRRSAGPAGTHVRRGSAGRVPAGH
jgi:hypothetical protein